MEYTKENFLELLKKYRERGSSSGWGSPASRTRKIINFLGLNKIDFKVIWVVGTNGKGSVSQYLSSILSKKHKVGLYTSPYMTSYNDQTRINGVEISDEKLFNYLRVLLPLTQRRNFYLNGLEMSLVISFMYFREEKVDYAIIEAGIGAKNDRSSFVKPTYSILTSLGLDHENALGNTKNDIYNHKIALIKKNSTVIMGDKFNYWTSLKKAKQVNADIHFLNKEEIKIVETFPLKYEYRNFLVAPKLQGYYQAHNGALAIFAAQLIDEDLTEEEIISGIEETYFPVRMDFIKSNILLEGAHNRDAFVELNNFIEKEYSNKKVKILFSAKNTRDASESIETLNKFAHEMVLTEMIGIKKSLKLEEMPDGYLKIKDTIEAYEYMKKNLKDDELLIVTGSLYITRLIYAYEGFADINRPEFGYIKSEVL